MIYSMSEGALGRAKQSLVGLAIGDAFGETLFGPPGVMAERVAARRLASYRPWPWTDDTAMALSVVDELARSDGIDPDALAEAFARRFVGNPRRGYGRGAFELLTAIAYGLSWRTEAAALFGGQGSFGNGAAMRVAPIGAYFAGDLERTRDEALRSAAPTHTHPDGAAGAVAVAVAASVIASGGDGAALLAAAARWTPPGRTLTGIERAQQIELGADPHEVGAELGTGREVAAHDTVPFCLWVTARHLDSYEDAVWTAAGQVGDRDTNGAIVGGLVVLATGVDAIPAEWIAAAEPIPSSLR